MQFQQGSQVTYVELEENDVNKRFIVPNLENLEGKVRGLLRGQPKVFLVRTGTATITSVPSDDVESVAGLQAIPSAVTALYNIQVHNHEVLGSAATTARYSDELTQLIAASDAVQPAQQGFPTIQQVPVAITRPPAPKVDLTDQLRAQMTGVAQNRLAAPALKQDEIAMEQMELVPEDKPILKMEDFIAQQKAKKAVSAPEPTKREINEALRPKPVGKIDVLIEEIEDLREELSELRQLILEMKSGLGV